MVSQTQASQNDIDDQRFAELLKPIKDLTQNWEVRSLYNVSCKLGRISTTQYLKGFVL